ncbi:MAG TPA: hypothetical protein VM051_03080 [Usitatibacter sp.]|nr:hypothetical protein [Usitatibacter sp.]
MTAGALWRPDRRDLHAMAVIVLATALLALPQLTSWLRADPLYYTSGLGMNLKPGLLPGAPYIDPNNGFQTQALGYRAARDWLGGEVPWWNPYTGVGLPLAAEYQPAAFFPLTPLLLLWRGTVWLQWSLHLLAGIGTFALLRQLGAGRTAALAGGIAFAFNGTLAWFAHGPAGVVPSLPWILLGIERAWRAAHAGLPTGWRTLGVAMAMSLLAGFPETAYINGLLALVWFALRAIQAASAARRAFLARVIAGGAAGVAIAAPQIIAFLAYLPEAYLAAHAGDFANSILNRPSIITSLVAPYAFGPIFAFTREWPFLAGHWGGSGGFATIALVAVAGFGFLARRRDALAWLLVAWVVSTVCKSFGIEPFLWLWNRVPAVDVAAFARYAQPSWELALVVLAAFGIDAIERDLPRRRALALIAAGCGAVGLAIAFAYGLEFWPDMASSVQLQTFAGASMAWAFASLAACGAWMAMGAPRTSSRALAAIVAFDAALMCAIPVASNPRGGGLNMRLVTFLQQNAGFSRVFSLGVMNPNYGAYFGIGSINHNYLPVPARWTQYVRGRLDTGSTDGVVFDGLRDDGAQLRENLRAYEEIGVKYFVTRGLNEPIRPGEGVTRVYRDEHASVYELQRAKPYFEPLDTSCTVAARERTRAEVQCAGPATLVRRELFFPGWTATVNGADAAVTEHGPLFQQVAVPGGRSEVRFSYAPAHIGWAWLVAFLGFAALVAPRSLIFRKHQ